VIFLNTQMDLFILKTDGEKFTSTNKKRCIWSLSVLCRMSASFTSQVTVFPARFVVKTVSKKSDEHGSVKNGCKTDRLYTSQTSTSSRKKTISAYLPFFNKTNESETLEDSFIAVLVRGQFTVSNSLILLTTCRMGFDGEHTSRFSVCE